MEAKQTDAEILIAKHGVGSKPATSVIERREKRRAENLGFLVPKPSAETFAKARLLDPLPGETLKRRSPELETVLNWIAESFFSGADEHDLFRCWSAWDSPLKMSAAKLPVRDVLDRLIIRARIRESELIKRSNAELQPERAVALMRATVAEAEARVKKTAHQLRHEEQTKLSLAKAELKRAEDRLKEHSEQAHG